MNAMNDNSSQRLARFALLAGASSGIAGGIGLLLLSFAVSFETAKSYLDGLAYSGSARFFTNAAFENMRHHVRLAGLLLCGIGWLLLARKQAFRRLLERLFTRLRGDGSAMRDALKRPKPHPTFIAAIAGITAVAAISRLAFLGEPMRYDEAYTFMRFASRSLLVVLSDYRFPNNHVLHTLGVWLAYHLFGDAPWALRLPAFFAGILMIPAWSMAAARFYNRQTAVITAGLLSASPILIAYSANARGYTMLGALFALTLGLANIISARNFLAAWLALAIVAALGFYTIPIMLLPFGLTITWLLLSHAAQPCHGAAFFRNMGVSLALTAFLTAILYAPIFIASDATPPLQNAMPLTWPEFFEQFTHSAQAVWEEWNAGLPLIMSAGLAIGFLVALFMRTHRTRARVSLITAVMAWCLPVVIAQMLSRVVFFPRLWLFLLPLYFMAASSGISALLDALLKPNLSESESPRYLFIFFLVLMFNGYVMSAKIPSRFDNAARDAEQVVLGMKNLLAPGDRILTGVPLGSPLWYYFHRHHLPAEYLFGALRDDGRVFVAAHTSTQSISSILNELQLAHRFNPDSATLIQTHDTIAVYLLKERKNVAVR